MEYLIYGFEINLNKYEMKEIFLWIFVKCILNVLVGNFIAKRKIQNRYYYLIRQGSFSRWWHRLVVDTLMLSFILLIIMFMGVSIFQLMILKKGYSEVVKAAILQAFFLYFSNFCFINTIQILIINIRNGEKISFLIVSVIEILSLYSGNLFGKIGCWLPGSFCMYKRSSFFVGSGYSVCASMLIQIMWIIVCFFIGNRKIVGRN